MSATTMTMRTWIPAAIGAMALLQPAWAEPAAEVRVTYSNGQFQPGVVNAPVDKPVVIRVRNLDAANYLFHFFSPCAADPFASPEWFRRRR